MAGWRESDSEGPDIRGNIGRGSDQDRERSGAEAEGFLGDIEYPIRKGDLVERAMRQGAPEDVRRLFDRLPDREYGSIVEVSRAIGELTGPADLDLDEGAG